MNLQSTINIHALKDAESVPLDNTLTHFAYKPVQWGVDDNGNILEPGHPSLEKVRRKFRKLIHRANKKIVGGVHAGKEEYEIETHPEPKLPSGRTKRIVMRGTQYCLESDGIDKNFGCYPSKEMAQAVMDGKAFIEPLFPDNIMACSNRGSCPNCGAEMEAYGQVNKNASDKRKCPNCGLIAKVHAGGPGSGRHKGWDDVKSGDPMYKFIDGILHMQTVIMKKDKDGEYNTVIKWRQPTGRNRPLNKQGVPAGVGKQLEDAVERANKEHREIKSGGPGSGRKKEAMKEYQRVYKLAQSIGYNKDDAHKVATEYYLEKYKNTSSMKAGGEGSGKHPEQWNPYLEVPYGGVRTKPKWNDSSKSQYNKVSLQDALDREQRMKDTEELGMSPIEAMGLQPKAPAVGHGHGPQHGGGAKLFKDPHIKYPKMKIPKTVHSKPLHTTPGVGHRMPNPTMHQGKGVGHRFPNPSFQASIYDSFGEPLAGANQQMHLDTNAVWFRPPSAKNSKPVPTDDPMEKDDRFGDVTKRNSKDTHKQRMKLLKRQAPGGLPPLVPARTTQVEPFSPYYNPGGLNASAQRTGRKRRLMVNEAGSFRAYGAASI